MTAIDRTAYPRFKRVVSGRELAEAFTPTAEEIVWACDHTQNEEHRLALVVRPDLHQVSRFSGVVLSSVQVVAVRVRKMAH